MDPADFVRPRALFDAVSRSLEPMRRANQPEEVKMLRRDRVDVGQVDQQHGHVTLSHTARSTPCVEGAGKSTPRSAGVPREYVEFRPEAILNLTTPAGALEAAEGVTILVASLADVIPSKSAADREKDRRALPRLHDLLERTSAGREN